MNVGRVQGSSTELNVGRVRGSSTELARVWVEIESKCPSITPIVFGERLCLSLWSRCGVGQYFTVDEVKNDYPLATCVRSPIVFFHEGAH